MSTNPADMTRREYVTVAELLERERTATEEFPWAAPDRRPRALTPAADLLRREGVRIDGWDEDNPESGAEATDELSPGERQTDKRSGKVAAMAGVAALSGLTIAGLIALSPPGSAPTSNAAAPGDDTQHGAAPTDGGATSPSSTVLKRASSEKAPHTAGSQPGDANRDGGATPGGAPLGSTPAGAVGNGGSGGSGVPGGSAATRDSANSGTAARGGAPASPEQPAPRTGAPTTPPTTPPTTEEPAKATPSKPAPRGPLSSVVGGVTGTLGKTVGGVGDLVGGLLGSKSTTSAPSTQAEPDPTTGSKSGTLDVE